MEQGTDREKEVTLKELSDRNPGVADDVEKIEIDIEAKHRQSSDGNEGGESLSHLMRDIIVGLIVGIMLFYLSGYLPALAGG